MKNLLLSKDDIFAIICCKTDGEHLQYSTLRPSFEGWVTNSQLLEATLSGTQT